MRVHVMTPYDLNKNLGDAYNRAMSMLPEGDWGCLIDYDVQFLTPDAIAIMHEYAKQNPHAGMLTCYTNRIGCTAQLLGGRFNESSDMLEHIRIADQRKKDLYKCTRLSGLTSGFLMLISKGTWNNIKFPCNGKCLGVDNDFAAKLHSSGKSILRMDGLYVFHQYRLRKNRFDTQHLK